MTERQPCATPRCANPTAKMATCPACQRAAVLVRRADVHFYCDLGWTAAAIAEQMGITTSAVGAHRLKPRPEIPPLTPSQSKRVLTLCADGHAEASIVRQTGFPAHQVHEVLQAPEAEDEMYGLLDGRWVRHPTRHVQVWVAA